MGGFLVQGGYMRIGIQGRGGLRHESCCQPTTPYLRLEPRDPCYTKSAVLTAGASPALNPCGGGTCKPAPQWGAYGYTCSCPSGFVAVNNTVKVSLPGAGRG